MRVIQINVFFCEACNNLTSTTAESGSYDDPVVQPPAGWDEDYDGLCPSCRTSLKEQK